MSFYTKFIDFIEPVIALALPALCLFCDKPLPPRRKIICPDCFDQMPPLPPAYQDVLKAEIIDHYFDEMLVVYQFSETFQKLIHFLKYQRYTTLAQYLAGDLARSVENKVYDLICCVPLHPVKEKERGYNQSALLAGHVARLRQSPFHPTLLKRTKNTVSQTTLHKEQRQANVDDAFSCTEQLAGKSILLIDDVITTGSTLNACARALKEEGAKTVDVAALATPMDYLQRNLEKETANLLIT